MRRWNGALVVDDLAPVGEVVALLPSRDRNQSLACSEWLFVTAAPAAARRAPASLAWALGNGLLWLLAMWPLYRKAIRSPV